MKTTNEWLDAVKAKHGLESDYSLAKLLGIAPQNVSHYRAGNRALDPYMATRVAELLNTDPMKVIASAEAERAKTEEKRSFWARIAACVLVSASAALTPPPAQAGTLHNVNYGPSDYTLSARRNRWLRLLGLPDPDDRPAF